ncbi:OmpA family protein [Pseudoxanthomonas composti]|uniref:OmpA family protein n=1 Tax=Pseudoxanthomonas composti TaxID=2137479 RepID=A0A4Q1JTP9_9GAMM|nr:OmpA family protein [Pseudoxanthomonas composti]RXR02034.1 OmpA family protein [Pseudoxanthomonas composti]
MPFLQDPRGRLVAALAWLLLLSGCAAAPTRITLLPDQDGHLGAVSIATAQGQERIDQAYGSVAVERATAAPAAARPVDRQAFESSHRALLQAQPTPPRSFVLNFKFDSMELTAESKKLLPQVLEVVRSRLPTEVTVFGYADSAGAADYNLALSAERARAVEKLLRQIDPALPVEVQYFGDKAPLVPTRPGVPEPRNRRAEIVVL